ncbi:MAG: tetratricopeptide repeat protein, partial [Acidobacteria bacterium]|nr:tetratricopeptide repeat protein [Acidobacteriota bacterium]
MSRRIGKIIFMILLSGIVFSQGEELRPPTADQSLLIWVQRVCDEAEDGMVAPAYEVRLGGQPHPVDLVEPFPVSAPVMVALLTAELQPEDWPVLTRWLEQAVRELTARSVPVWGAWCEPAIALATPAVVRTALADARQEAETAMLDVPRPASAILDDIRRQVETACPPWQPATVLVIGRDFPGPPSEMDLHRPALTDALVAVMTRRCVGVYGLLLGEAAGPLSRALPTLAATPVGLAEEDGRRVARRILRDREQQRVLTIPYPADLVGARSHELVVTEVTTACRCRSRAVLWLVPPDLSVPNRTDLERATELRRTLGSESSSSDIMGQIVTATEIVRLSPFTVGDRLHLARLHAQLNSWPEVRAVLTQAQQLFPQAAAVYAEWGRVHEQTGETAAARLSYEQALARDDDLPEIRRELARLYQADGETERAVAQLERLAGSAVDGPEVRLELAAGYADLGQPDRAIQAARVAVEQSGGAATSRLYLAELYLQQARWPDVLALLPAPTTDSQHDARWDRVAGLAHIGLAQYSTARPFLERAVEATPEDIPLQLALAQAYRQEGLWPEAAEVLARLVSFPEVPPDVHLELAAVRQENGEFLDAGAVLVAAAERWPDEPDIWRALGTWADRRGDLERAIAAGERLAILNHAGDSSAIQERLAYLHLLNGASLSSAARCMAQAGRAADADRLSALAVARNAAQANVPPASERLRLPGGVTPMFRFAPCLENRPRDDVFLRLLFEYILDGDPLDSGKNPRQAEWVSFLRSYVEFQEWLKKKNLYQPTLTLRFSADKAVLKQTNRILSFFDVSIKRKKKKGKVVLEANLGQGDNDLRRRKVLEFVGFNPNVVRLDSEFTFQFEADTLPVLLGPSFWLENVLDKKPHQAPELLRWWLEKPAAMKLYVALSRIPQPAAEWFQRHIRPDRLPDKIMPGLYAFGAMLKFEPDGRLWLPGGETGVSRWERLIGESLTAKPDKFIEKVFTKNNGRAIYFLAALSQAPPEVSGYLMASEERFKRFYNTVEEPGEDFQSGKYFRKYHDFGDLLVMLEMDDDGIAFPGSPQLWLLAAKHGFSTQSFSKLHKLLRRKVKFKGEGEMLHNLLDKAREGTALKGVRKYAVLTYLSETMPELMADEMGIAMELLFDRFGPQYQIIAEIEMDPQLTRRFFALLERLDKLGDDSRRTNILLFQGTLGLIQLLNRQDAMTDAVARQLCQQFFDRLGSVGDPGVVAMATASFLREDVATAL